MNRTLAALAALALSGCLTASPKGFDPAQCTAMLDACRTQCEAMEPEDNGQGCIDLECNPLYDAPQCHEE